MPKPFRIELFVFVNKHLSNIIKSKTSISNMDALIHRGCSNHATYSDIGLASLSNMILQVPTGYEAILLM